MRFCTNCGFKITDETTFCPKCGTKQASQSVDKNESNTDSFITEDLNNKQEHSVADNITTQEPPVTDNNAQIDQPKHLNFAESVKYILSNLFEFNTTVQDSQKSIFWWNYLLVGITSFLVTNFLPVSISKFELLIISTLILIFLVASMMRRLNYLGKNKNIAWLSLIPIVGLYPIILMFFNKKDDK